MSLETMSNLPFQPHKEGVRLFVRLTPKSAQNRIDGVGQNPAGQYFLQARVTAPPEKGKANQALIVLLATSIDLPKSKIRLMSGETSRLKTVLIMGDTQAIMGQLKNWLENLV